MPTEQRVITTKGGIKARPAPGAADNAVAGGEGAEPAKSKKKPLLIVVLLVVLLGGGAGYWFLMGPGAGSGTEAPAAEPEPEPGEVYTIEAISLNLAGGHYLRLGMGLQLTADIAHEPDPAKALDLAIGLFSGRGVQEVQSTEGREALRAELAELLDEAYHGEVMGVYFTDYVTQ